MMFGKPGEPDFEAQYQERVRLLEEGEVDSPEEAAEVVERKWWERGPWRSW